MTAHKLSPGFEQRQPCSTCKKVESMQHILLECKPEAIVRTLMWKNAKEPWPQEWHRRSNITLRTILGIGHTSLPENEGRHANEHGAISTRTRGRMRLLQILIPEASHLIWVLRLGCESLRVIHRDNRQHPDQEVNARWLKIINDRLTSDRIIATKIKRDKQFTQLVNATWKNNSRTEEYSTGIGCNIVRFLVGMRD
jgi:hypothetical protein